MLCKLLECTVQMLNLLYESYQTQRITYNQFLDNTELKVKFLEENIEFIEFKEEKYAAQDILEKCCSIYAYKNSKTNASNSLLDSSTLL